MAKTAYISVRIDPKIKEEAEKILKELGLTVSEAITLLFRQIILHNGLPFKVDLPKKKHK
jgi:DNA-damage-inducible protein J